MSDQHDRWTEVGARLRARQLDLGWTTTHLARQADLDEKTVRSLLRGTPRAKVVQPSTLSRLSQALGWQPDAIDRLLQGREPAEAAPSTQPAVVTIDDIRAIREEIRRQGAVIELLQDQLQALREGRRLPTREAGPRSR